MVRISPFNAAGKRQTSFVSCDVMPDIEEDLDVEIADDDIRIDTYRSSGAGGQHINKTSSAIRITHFPTGIVVQCQNERSQHMNKDKAMQMLKAKLYILKQQEQLEKASGIRGDPKRLAGEARSVPMCCSRIPWSKIIVPVLRSVMCKTFWMAIWIRLSMHI